jgi:hypothetical protein
MQIPKDIKEAIVSSLSHGDKREIAKRLSCHERTVLAVFAGEWERNDIYEVALQIIKERNERLKLFGQQMIAASTGENLPVI